MRDRFKSLGFGLGFRPCHYDALLRDRPSTIDWLEVISENFMNVGGKPRRILEQARSHYPIALHGVGLSIGSYEPTDPTYLDQLQELIQWINPALISDHLCFTTWGKHNSHDLLPIPYTMKLLHRVAEKIDILQSRLGRRFLLENPSAYVSYDFNDMTESEFFRELIQRTGCGMLLDLNNLYVNQMNLGLNPIDYLKQIPYGAVGQIHLAGHSLEQNELGIVRIDTHDHDILPEVWALYQIAAKTWPDASTMIEWDDQIPSLSTLISSLDHARSLARTPSDTQENGVNTSPKPSHIDSNRSARAWDAYEQQAQFFSMAVDDKGFEREDPRLAVLAPHNPVSAELGMRVYHNAYFARLYDALKDDFPTLAAVTTDEAFAAIVSSYLHAYPPVQASMGALGQHLANHLALHPLNSFEFGLEQIALADIAALDRLRCEAFIHPNTLGSLAPNILAEVTEAQWNTLSFEFQSSLVRLNTHYDIAPVWDAVQAGARPNLPVKTSRCLAVWRHEETVWHQTLDENDAFLLAAQQGGSSFATAASGLAEARQVPLEMATQEAVARLMNWFQRGWIVGIRS